MIDVETPSSLTGLGLLVLAIFVIGSFIITTGFWPVFIALVAGAIVVYLAVKILKGLDRRATRIFSGGNT